MNFSRAQYPDVYKVKELSVRLNVSESVIAEWFEKKRSQYREKEALYFQVLAKEQKQPQLYNQRLLADNYHAQAVSQPAVMAQASGSTSYTGQQQVIWKLYSILACTILIYLDYQ